MLVGFVRNPQVGTGDGIYGASSLQPLITKPKKPPHGPPYMTVMLNIVDASDSFSFLSTHPL
jgi:hypothetical protein